MSFGLVACGNFKKLVVVIVVSLITVALPAPGATAATQATRATGVVIRDGVPVAGAELYLAAWPNQFELHALPPGGEVMMHRFDPVTTGRDGQWVIEVPRLDKLYVNDEGVANLQLTVLVQGEVINWGFPLTVDPTAQSAAERRSGDAADVPQSVPHGDRIPTTVYLKVEVGAEPGIGLSGDVQRDWLLPDDTTPSPLTSSGLLRVDKGLAPAIDRSSDLSAMTVNSGTACPASTGYMTKTGSMKYGLYEAFANVYATSTRGPATLYQAYSSSHTLGIAFKNTSGSWSQSGTYSFQQTFGGSGTSANLVDKRVSNQVNYAEYRCGQLYSNQLLGYTWLPDSIYAIASRTESIVHPIWGSCAAYSAGDEMSKTAGTNVTFSAGVGFSPIKLSAQAGWSAETKLTWNFTGNAWLCGSTANGWFSSPQAEAHNR